MSQIKYVCFTSFNMHINWQDLDLSKLDSQNKIQYLIFQGELCKDGKKHIQGYMEFNHYIRYNTIKKLFGDSTMHLEKRYGTAQQAADYCKELKHGVWLPTIEFGTMGTTEQGKRNDLLIIRDQILAGRTIKDMVFNTQSEAKLKTLAHYNKFFEKFEKQYKTQNTINKLKETYKNTTFNPLQQQIIDIVEKEIETEETRKVHWVSDTAGNAGKSFLSRYLIANNNAFYITGGKQQDILYAYDGQPVIIYDLARTYADNLEHIYTTIENFKNAQYLSTKYESELRIYEKAPTVIVMANFAPDTSKLTNNRWNIIDTGTLLTDFKETYSPINDESDIEEPYIDIDTSELDIIIN